MFNSWFHRPNKVIIAFSVCRSSPWIVDRWGLPCWAGWVDVLGIFFGWNQPPKNWGKKHQTWDRNGRIAKNHEITIGETLFFEVVYGDFRQNCGNPSLPCVIPSLPCVILFWLIPLHVEIRKKLLIAMEILGWLGTHPSSSFWDRFFFLEIDLVIAAIAKETKSLHLGLKQTHHLES